MKFTCDSCSAQYMISDEKVGPNGVKVRCKKCGHTIVVRRTEGASAPAGAPAQEAKAEGKAAEGARAPEKGLDAELGTAFDHAFGDTPPSTPKPDAGPDLAATQMMGEADAAKITAAPQPAAPSATEWYVAIGQAQVGPLPVSEVKKKWEAGDVGPDSLVWRPGMGDWSPLSTVAELASYLAPIPRAAPAAARDLSRAEAPSGGGGPAAMPAPAPEATWKPVGASALAALASEEIASRKAPEPRPQTPRPAATTKSLMDALPDGGGVDPTGAIPLSIKALETTGEKKIERRTSVARGAEEVRHRRGVARAVLVGVLAVVIVVGAAVAGVVWYMNRKLGQGPAAIAARQAPPVAQPPVAAQPAPTPAPPAATPAPAPAAPAAPPAAAAPPRVAEAEPAAPRPKAAEPARPPPAPKHVARREPAPKPERVVAQQAPPPPPQPAPEAKKKKDDLLDFDGKGGGDSALDEALGKTPSGRSVYVPPARKGGSTDVPDKLSPGDINQAVAQRIDSLRRCVSEQKTRDPSATGTLKMRWMIAGDGTVRDVKCLTPEYAQGPFAQCIAGVVRTIKFPRSQTTGQEVTFPFNF